MSQLRFAIFGAGFWARYQLAGWAETGLAQPIAICDPVREKAEALAAQFGIPAIYTDPQALLDHETLDFVDICSSVETHVPLIQQAAERGLNIICQKPLAMSLLEAESAVKLCEQRGVMLLVNENWRWQYPLRQLKKALDTGHIGRVFRARIDYRNSFPVFDNQPFLKTLDQFILTDIGVHILDAARFLFGEAVSLYCHTQRIHPDINGEDVATVMLKMASGATVVCDMSYATRREHDRFPETYVDIEGENGSLVLAPDFWIRETTASGTLATRHKPPRYAWADPAYDVAHSSVVPCQINLARALAGQEAAETTGADNFKTLQLVYGSYESARTGNLIAL